MHGDPRILTGFHADDRPIGVAIWARLSDEVAERYSSGTGRLRPDEWTSGEQLWLIDLITPFADEENKQAELMLSELVRGPFEGAPALCRRRDPESGKMVVARIARKEDAEGEEAAA